MNNVTLFWANGMKELIRAKASESFEQAMTRVGFGPAAIAGLSFHKDGNYMDDYYFDHKRGVWWNPESPTTHTEYDDTIEEVHNDLDTIKH